MKYVYPAIFTEEKKGDYSIEFPDIDGCFTCGTDLADGIAMAADVLIIMQNSVSELHRVVKTVGDYIQKKDRQPRLYCL